MDKSDLGVKGNSERLLEELKPVVEKQLPQKPREPSPFPERPDHAAPSDEAQQLQQTYMQEFQQAWKEVIEITSSGSFKAPKRKRGGGGVGAPRKKRAANRAARERSVRADEVALVGEEFEEDGIEWKVLAVDWSDVDAAMVVWYYDVEAAKSAKLTEEEMESKMDAGEGCAIDALEFSSVREVKKWIKVSQGT